MTRLIFFGMRGQFSLIPLQKLVAAKADIQAVIVPADRPQQNPPRRLVPEMPTPSALPLVDPYLEPNIIHLAWSRQIPVWELASLRHRAVLPLLAELQPDLISVVCFPYIFPPSILQLPRYGCLNLHPSLLPAYRGPAPLFWIARQDERQTGVTLHFLDQELDTGDIVAQTGFERPDGLSGAELEGRCAGEGAALLLEALRQLERTGQLSRRPQPEVGASYFPWPSGPDYLIPTTWPARRAFNFLRGAEGWPLKIDLGDQHLPIRRAISYLPDQALDQPYRLLGSEAWIGFQPGVLRAKI